MNGGEKCLSLRGRNSSNARTAPTIAGMQNVIENHPRHWLHCLPQPDAHSHKYRRGYLMLLGGYPMTGAARLAALAGARVGAGITRMAVPKAALPCYASMPASLLVSPFDTPADLQALLTEPRINAYLIGPGAGPHETTRLATDTALASGKAVVLDADALTVLGETAHMTDQASTASASASPALTALAARVSAPCVLTPHAGEFTRLTGMSPAAEMGARIAQVQACAAHSQTVVVLKGSDSIIASPQGQVCVNRAAPATLATAGAGDVLAGLIAGLLAQGMPPFEAAAAAVWMHSAVAKAFGPGLIADDLPQGLPAVLAQLLPLKSS